MRKNIVAGNWKMNKKLQEGITLATELNQRLNAQQANCEVIICPAFTHLAGIASVIEQKNIKLGAQNCAAHLKGAYTGEVSVEMIASTGASHVIIGHSERRQYYGETNAGVHSKTQLALQEGLRPIVCFGEKLEEREAGKHFEVVKTQITEALFDFSADEFGKLIIAYEPLWAIGTGKTASAEQVQEMHVFIRYLIAEKFGTTIAEQTSILYGGSCNASNAKDLFSKPDVDGGLIGGASLTANDFLGIVDAFN